jgi:hypothetical protein
MDTSHSRAELLRFLGDLGKSGAIGSNSADSLKAACSKVLGVLSDVESQDVRELNVEEIFERFLTLYGRNYGKNTLTSYKSRVRTALERFRCSDSKEALPRRQFNDRRIETDLGGGRQLDKTVPSQSELVGRTLPPMGSANVMSIPIRADMAVIINGLPWDLSEIEARKIVAVINAMTTPKG